MAHSAEAELEATLSQHSKVAELEATLAQHSATAALEETTKSELGKLCDMRQLI